MDKTLSWAVSLHAWLSMSPAVRFMMPKFDSSCGASTVELLVATGHGGRVCPGGDAMSHHHPMQLRPAICSVASKALGALDSTPKVWQNSFWSKHVQAQKALTMPEIFLKSNQQPNSDDIPSNLRAACQNSPSNLPKTRVEPWLRP